MIDKRLSKFLREQDLTAKQFAEEIGVLNSTVSHILSGRNKPSFDFIEKVLRHYPDLNPDWLILGKSPMIRERVALKNSDPMDYDDGMPSLFSGQQSTQSKNADNSEPKPAQIPQQSQVTTQPAQDSAPQDTVSATVPFPIPRPTEVEQVMIFYKDGTFSAYKSR